MIKFNFTIVDYGIREYIRYYYFGSRYMQIDLSGLTLLDTSIPQTNVDYDDNNRPKIVGVDLL